MMRAHLGLALAAKALSAADISPRLIAARSCTCPAPVTGRKRRAGWMLGDANAQPHGGHPAAESWAWLSRGAQCSGVRRCVMGATTTTPRGVWRAALTPPRPPSRSRAGTTSRVYFVLLGHAPGSAPPVASVAWACAPPLATAAAAKVVAAVGPQRRRWLRRLRKWRRQRRWRLRSRHL